jgi:hypothetical protein
MTKARSIRFRSVVVAVALVLMIGPASAHAAPAGAIDRDACIASDALGYRYVALGRTGVSEPGVYLSTNRTGTWRVGAHPVVPGERCVAIVIDGARHVHLLVVRPIPEDLNDNENLYYSTNQSGSWRSSLVRYGEIGVASLAIDRTGRANIVTTDEDGVLLFERSTSGGWITRYSATGWPSHLRTDPAGNLWVVIADASNQRVVRLTDRNGVWVATRIPISWRVPEFDLAIDESGRRYLATHDPATGAVRIYRDRGSTWPLVDRTTALAGRRLMEMDIEPSGAIHLLFQRFEPRRAVVDLNRHGGSWHTQLVGYSSGFWSDIEVDGRGRVSAVFDRDGVVWSYWNPWTKPPNRFAISSL